MPKAKRIPAKNRILSVTIRRLVDDSPDTSWLGEYSEKQTSAYSIDRAHSEDCASVNQKSKAQTILEHARNAVVDCQKKEKLESNEWYALEDAYDQLNELVDEVAGCDCGKRGDMERNEYRYFNPSFNYVTKDDKPADGLTDEEVRKYVRQDYERMESLNRGNWCFLGILADAKIGIPSNKDSGGSQRYTVQEIASGGEWGYESDMSQTDFDEAESEQLADLKDQLAALGFKKRAIATAFKNVEHKEA